MKVLQSFGLVGALAATLMMGGCSTTETWAMNTAGAVPAAQGKVQVADKKGGNRDVKVEVQHLAPPEMVVPGTSTYVVWLTPENGVPQNIGALHIGEKREGKLETKTAYRTFEITVTAEASPNTAIPTTSPVMRVAVPA